MPIDHIGLCSWSVQPDSPESLVQALESAGITAVQLALTPCVRAPDRWAGVMESLRAAGVTVLSGMMEPSVRTLLDPRGDRPHGRSATGCHLAGQ